MLRDLTADDCIFFGLPGLRFLDITAMRLPSALLFFNFGLDVAKERFFSSLSAARASTVG